MNAALEADNVEHGRNRPSNIFLHNLKLTWTMALAEIDHFVKFEH